MYILNPTESNTQYPYTMEWILEFNIHFDLLVLLKICFPPPIYIQSVCESSVTKEEKFEQSIHMINFEFCSTTTKKNPWVSQLFKQNEKEEAAAAG